LKATIQFAISLSTFCMHM